MIQWLGKLGMSSTTTPEARLLSLDIVDTIWAWEQKRQPPVPSTQDDGDDMDVDEAQGAVTWTMTTGHREALVSYLMKLVVFQADHKGGLVQRSLSLLSEMLAPGIWSDVQVKLIFFLKAFDQVSLWLSSSSMRTLHTITQRMHRLCSLTMPSKPL
jgi:transformation/transcription domain-associated protein